MGLITRALNYEQRNLTATEAVRRMFQSTVTRSGVAVNEQNAMQLMAVFTAVRVLSEAFAQVPLKVYRRKSNGSREEALDHPLYKILHDQPNPEMTSFTLREVMVGHIALWGNAYCEIMRNYNNDVIGLWPLLPNRTRPMRSPDGRLFYRTQIVRDPAGVEPPESIDLPARNVLHVPGFGFDGLKGLSVIGTVREGIGLAFAYEAFGEYFFGNNTVPGLTLATDQPMKKEQVDVLERKLKEAHEGLTNSQRLMILTSGLKPVQIGMPLVDAQFIEQRKFSRSEIMGLYRIPPHMVNDTEKVSSWGTGIEQMSVGFVVYTMMPYFKRFEQSMNMKLLGANAQAPIYPEFDPEGFLRGDYKTRMEGYAIARQWGWLSANDIKRKENEPTIGKQGDVYLQALNYQGADKALEEPAVAPRGMPGTGVDVGVEAGGTPPTTDQIGARSHRHALADVTGRILRREQTDVSKGIERILKRGSLEDLPAWLEQFYAEHRRWAAKQAAPVFAGISESVGVQDGRLVVAASNAYVDRLCSESMDGIRRAMRGETRIDRVLGETEQRAERIAANEIALATQVFTAGSGQNDEMASEEMWREVLAAIREKAPIVVNVAAPPAVVNVAPAPAPVVNVELPTQPTPVVNVSVPEQAAPQITVRVPEQHAPEITVNVPEQVPPQIEVNVPSQPVNVTVEESEREFVRDRNGLITGYRPKKK